MCVCGRNIRYTSQTWPFECTANIGAVRVLALLEHESYISFLGSPTNKPVDSMGTVIIPLSCYYWPFIAAAYLIGSDVHVTYMFLGGLLNQRIVKWCGKKTTNPQPPLDFHLEDEAVVCTFRSYLGIAVSVEPVSPRARGRSPRLRTMSAIHPPVFISPTLLSIRLSDKVVKKTFQYR